MQILFLSNANLNSPREKVIYLFTNFIKVISTLLATNYIDLTAIDPLKSHYLSILYAVANFSHASPNLFLFFYKKLL